MKNILVISYSPLHRDPRILRQVQALKASYKIYTIGDTSIPDNTITHYSNKNQNHNISGKKRKFMKVLYLIKNFYRFYPAFLEVRLNLLYIFSLNIPVPNFIIANDWDGLYLASKLKNVNKWQCKIYFDAHEYAPKQFDNSIRWRLFTRSIIMKALKLCKKDISKMSTVCEGIAKEYESFFNFPAGFVDIITNTPDYQKELKPQPVIDGKIKLIHHGGAQKERKLELLIDMMRYLDFNKYELTFMLIQSDPKYYEYLVKLSKRNKNIRFIDPVPYQEITRTLNNYDIGVYILRPNNFNEKYALPNKLFEFIQARLAVAIGPSIEMVKIVKNYALGVFADDFSPPKLADAVARISYKEIMNYKNNSEKYAEILSSEENIRKIRKIFFTLEKTQNE